jgi:hypothetical protein
VHMTPLEREARGLVPMWHDVASRWHGHDLVAPTVVARLTDHMSYDAWVLVD